MRIIALAICFLGLLFAPAAAGSMFDLPVGTWSVTDDATRTFSVIVGEGHAMEWRLDPSAKDAASARVRGTYKVSATKMGDFHTTFTVEEIALSPADCCEDPAVVDFLGARVRKGDKVRLFMQYASQGEDEVMFTVFDQESQVVFSRTLKELRPPR